MRDNKFIDYYAILNPTEEEINANPSLAKIEILFGSDEKPIEKAYRKLALVRAPDKYIDTKYNLALMSDLKDSAPPEKDKLYIEKNFDDIGYTAFGKDGKTYDEEIKQKEIH